MQHLNSPRHRVKVIDCKVRAEMEWQEQAEKERFNRDKVKEIPMLNKFLKTLHQQNNGGKVPHHQGRQHQSVHHQVVVVPSPAMPAEAPLRPQFVARPSPVSVPPSSLGSSKLSP